MSDPAREQILRGVEAAVAQGPAPQPTGREALAEVPWLAAGESWDQAQAALEALGDRLEKVDSHQELAAAIGEIVRKHQVKLAVRWDHPLLDQVGIDSLLAEQGAACQPIIAEEDLRGPAAQAQLGITVLDALVTGSGSLVMRHGPGRERAVSLLPEVHLALVTPERRVRAIHDLTPLWQQWRARPEGPPSAVTMVTGHSRTADIELIIVSGVHGPKYVYVLGINFSLKD